MNWFSELIDRLRKKGSWWTRQQISYQDLGNVEISTPIKRSLKLSPIEWLRLGQLRIGTAGEMNRNQDGTGRMPVVANHKWMYIDQEPQKQVTSDDTAVEIDETTDHQLLRLISAYQDSGGALTLSILRSSDDAVIWVETVNNSTPTILNCHVFQWYPKLKVKWSAVAGVNQDVTYVTESLQDVN